MRALPITVLLPWIALPLAAQEPPQPPTFTSVDAIMAELDHQGEVGEGGAAVTISAPDEFAPEIFVRRRFASQPNNASVHPVRDEIYHIMAGGGTLMTGGTVADPADRTAGLRGGETREIRAGDVIVIPAGMLHWFSRIDGSITYMNIRLGPPAP